MKAVILAAGIGSRMLPLTADTSKSLLPIGDTSILDQLLTLLPTFGVDEILVVAGHCFDAMEAACGERATVLFNPDYATTNSITSLATAAPGLRGSHFLMLNGDVFLRGAALESLLASPTETACLVDPYRRFNPQEMHVKVDGDLVRAYGLHVPEPESAGESAQTVKISAADSALFLDRIEALNAGGDLLLFPSAAYDVLIEHGKLGVAYTRSEDWCEVDTIEDYDALVRSAEFHRETHQAPSTGPHR